MLATTMKFRVWRTLAVAALASAPGLAQAVANCSVSATSVAFGSYNPLSASNTDSTGTVTVSCTLGGIISLLVNYTINLSKGGAATYTPRRMTSGSNTMNYNLYTNSSRTTIWGDGTGGTTNISDGYLLGIGTTVRNYTVFGRIPPLQNIAPGAYADTITITVNY